MLKIESAVRLAALSLLAFAGVACDDEGGSPAEWARLISSLGVLGETDRARAIYGNAQQAFAGDDAALSEIDAAARRAGVME